jgi:hypothetical protein
MARVKTPPVSSLTNPGFVMPYPEIEDYEQDQCRPDQQTVQFLQVMITGFFHLPCTLQIFLTLTALKPFLASISG